MKLSHLFNNLPKRIAAGAIVALAFAFPLAVSAADMVQIEGSIGVANVTNGDTNYVSSVNATYDQVVKVEVYYHNRENPDSGKIAQNLRVKIDMPTAAGKTQTITETTSADNSNTVTDSATVNLDRSDAYLQYIPGSAIWRHNTGTNTNINMVDTKISDAIVNGGQGLVLENEKPCYNFAATVTVLARVMVPGVKVIKQVEKAGQSNAWTTQNTANPGDTLKYMITYQNTGNTTQNNVVIRDNLPPKMTLVPNTTVVYTTTTPNGSADTSNNITGGGIDIGSYLPSAGAYIVFEVKVPTVDQLACGQTEFRNVGIAHPKDMNEYYNTAITDVNKTCETPKTPTYTCDAFHVTTGDNRTVKVASFTTSQTNGAAFKDVVINWGDNTTPLTTNTAVGKTHQYAKDGTYNLSATAHFTVNGKDVTASGASCNQTVTFTTPGTPPPSTPPTLVNTGPGQVAGLFAAVAVAGAFAHRLFLSRKLAR
jgi:uncharacterized repeat protein (TIGR01451 family)